MGMMQNVLQLPRGINYTSSTNYLRTCWWFNWSAPATTFAIWTQRPYSRGIAELGIYPPLCPFSVLKSRILDPRIVRLSITNRRNVQKNSSKLQSHFRISFIF
jgi:F0F1-type ATP synthase beta subunit